MNSSTSFCDWSWAMVLHHASSPSFLAASMILGSARAELPVTQKTQVRHKTTIFKRVSNRLHQSPFRLCFPSRSVAYVQRGKSEDLGHFNHVIDVLVFPPAGPRRGIHRSRSVINRRNPEVS